MLKRVLAWVLLIGFILFIVNFAFIGLYRTESIVVYLVIIAAFLIANNKKYKKKI